MHFLSALLLKEQKLVVIFVKKNLVVKEIQQAAFSKIKCQNWGLFWVKKSDVFTIVFSKICPENFASFSGKSAVSWICLWKSHEIWLFFLDISEALCNYWLVCCFDHGHLFLIDTCVIEWQRTWCVCQDSAGCVSILNYKFLYHHPWVSKMASC